MKASCETLSCRMTGIVRLREKRAENRSRLRPFPRAMEKQAGSHARQFHAPRIMLMPCAPAVPRGLEIGAPQSAERVHRQRIVPDQLREPLPAERGGARDGWASPAPAPAPRNRRAAPPPGRAPARRGRKRRPDPAPGARRAPCSAAAVSARRRRPARRASSGSPFSSTRAPRGRAAAIAAAASATSSCGGSAFSRTCTSAQARVRARASRRRRNSGSPMSSRIADAVDGRQRERPQDGAVRGQQRRDARPRPGRCHANAGSPGRAARPTSRVTRKKRSRTAACA